ncbi:hypothetical protein [Variovorax sp. dw_308]|uniref:hypothetical protein n=1 Tax=Variovorax sp. dw_308 TaxID=2721546 RepID=UPI001C47B6F0|nr:hypothetical protein [Variovorax sp. dw_308]
MTGATLHPCCRQRLPTLCRRVLPVAVTLLLAQAGGAQAEGSDKPPPLPTQVSAAGQQYQRWAAAFAAWRAAATASSWESPREAAIRKATRLSVIPTPTPLLGTQRRLDGHAIVVSMGLIALLDELLLAEATSTGCFDGYANEVADVLNGNQREARAYTEALAKSAQGIPTTGDKGQPVRALPATPVNAWPRLGDRIGKAGTACENVKPAALQSASTRAWITKNADSVPLWVLTRQVAILAADPAIETPVPKPDVPSASSQASQAPNAQAPAPAPVPPPWPSPSPAKAACLDEIAAAAKAAAAATVATTVPPSQRAHLALCTTEHNDQLRTLKWLQTNAGLLGTL